MRIAFVNALIEEARKNKNIILLTADLGFSVFEEYMKFFPRQYINVGISEQNMTGVAAGLAMEGKLPIMYSIVPFVTMRNFEQIRNDICYQNLNVKIVGVGAGFSYGPYAHTHHGLEDIGILRTLANLTIVCPGDPLEVKLATYAAIKHKGPVYMRLGKAGEPVLHKTSINFKLGKGIILREGKDLTIVATSTLLERGQEVAESLKKAGLNARLVSMHTVKPIDKELLFDSIAKTKALFTLEEHSVIGGLGSAVAEVIAESGCGITFKRFGVNDHFTKVIGMQEYMRKANNLTTDQIVRAISDLLKKNL